MVEGHRHVGQDPGGARRFPPDPPDPPDPPVEPGRLGTDEFLLRPEQDLAAILAGKGVMPLNCDAHPAITVQVLIRLRVTCDDQLRPS